MKIVLIHGQNHKGSSYHIGRLLANRLLQHDEDVTEFFLPRDLNGFCIGCYQCLEDDTKCPYYAEKQPIEKALDEADLMIFTTPTYCLRASASMKALIDLTFTRWMTHRPRAGMFSKKAVVISTAAGAGTKTAIKDVATCLFYWGVPFIKRYGIKVQAMNWEGVAPAKKKKAEQDMQKLASRLQACRKPRVGLKTKATFWMMAKMQKAGWGSSPIEKQYWEAKGWLGKARPWRGMQSE